MADPVLFAVGLSTMYAAHNFADHIAQTDHMAANKAEPGEKGWLALIDHVLIYHLVTTLMLITVIIVLGLDVTGLGFIAALLFSAISHGFLDRRWPVKWILEHTGSPEFVKLQQPISGMYLADQALHYMCLWISALLLVIL